ncbi:energy transducer TonB [Erythrobacter oryzae]|uniref:energy transducer TonB n=1 Tax=Erythrobacter oryzae TaxID=3019556 RepID=UPI0025578A3B|nr:energy transducer TonB [Erythrobacter sp. COR-2]
MIAKVVLAGLALSGVLQGSGPMVGRGSVEEPPLSEVRPRGVVPMKQSEWAQAILASLEPVSCSGVFGQVGVTVTVSRAGRAEDCVVTASSGYPVLDDAVCRAVLRHARFMPALDENGTPVAGTWRTKVTTSPD